ncbi:MAG: ribonuclease HII [Anaerolineales bacterium]
MPPSISPDLAIEMRFWRAGLTCLAGLDEAGRGAWAGPVAAAAVVFPADETLLQRLSGVRDSKLMTPRQRSYWADKIKQEALAWGVGMASWEEIDVLGILNATRLAMRRALEQLTITPQQLLLDALRLPEVSLPQEAIIKGDRYSLSIAAASVLAKTSRDAWMIACEHDFPGYGFSHHKGYGTSTHKQALGTLGPCAIHRKTFAPIARLEKQGGGISATTSK